MGVPITDQGQYTHETYKQLRGKLKKLNNIINNPNTDINKKVKAIQKRYEVEQELLRQRSYLKVISTEERNKQENTVIRISDLISGNFYEYFKTDKPYRILKGGRSSLKSSAISLKLVLKFLEDDKANVVCFRKVGKYLSTSIYEQMKWAINMLGVSHEFTFLKSPLKIKHNVTNTAIYFYGVDEPQKIKSAKIAEGYVTDLWFEEATEFKDVEEIDTVSDTFIRQDLPDNKQVEVTFSYNPPRNPYNWINEWIEELRNNDDYYIHHSTYMDDTKGFLSEQFLKKVRAIKETDPDYHDWMYGGKVIGIGDTVYNFSLFKTIDEVPDNDKLIFADLAIDTGYSVSATTFLYLGYTLKGNVILLDTYYYSPINKVQKKAPSDFSKDLKEFIDKNSKQYKTKLDTRIIDSADGALRNEFFKMNGYALIPVTKKEKHKMIENVESFLVSNKFYVLNTDNNKVFLEEHKKYQWDPDSIKKSPDKPRVLKVDDHTCDAFQYYVNSNLQKLGLKL